MQSKLVTVIVSLCLILCFQFSYSQGSYMNNPNNPYEIIITPPLCFSTVATGTADFSFVYADFANNGAATRYPATGTVTALVTNDGTSLTINIASTGFAFPDLSFGTGVFDIGSNEMHYDLGQTQCPALPIYLSSFTATTSGVAVGYAKLTWVTTQESNSSHFVIQRTTSGAPWVDHGLEPAVGNSALSTTYNFYTNCPNAGTTYYYRLKMIDIDGQTRYSIAKAVNGSGSGNPTNFCNYTTIEGNGTICSNTAVFKVHNAAAGLAWSVSSGSVAASNGGTIGTFSGCLSASATLTASSGGCNKTKTLTVCSGVGVDGPESICTSGNVSVLNPPAGASISWTAFPSGIVSIGCTSCATTSITKITEGQVTLTATLANSCIAPISKSIKVIGVPDYTKLGIVSQGPVVCPNVTVGFGARYNGTSCTNFLAMDITNVTWSVSPSPTQINSNAGTSGCGQTNNSGVTIKFPSQGSTYYANVRITATNACGTSYQSDPYLVTVKTSGMCGGGGGFAISPNPASNNVTISAAAPSNLNAATTQRSATTTTKIFELKISDKTGTVRKTARYPGGVASVQINLTGLAADIYIVNIFDGANWTNQELIVR